MERIVGYCKLKCPKCKKQIVVGIIDKKGALEFKDKRELELNLKGDD